MIISCLMVTSTGIEQGKMPSVALWKSLLRRWDCAVYGKSFFISHTHIHTDNKSFSTLDHFLVDPELLKVIDEAEAVHLGDNLSRHSPIVIKVRLESLPARPKHLAPQPRRRPAWYKATERQQEEYRQLLELKLSRLDSASCLDCRDPLCKEAGHSEDRDCYVLDMMGAMIEASIETLPKTGGKGRVDAKEGDSYGAIPGWNETVEPRRQDAIHWHAIWLSAGKPNKGVLHSVMASTRNKYHYAIRAVRRQADVIKAKKLWEANQRGPMDLIKEMKALKKGSKVTKLPDTVEGKNSEEEIVEEFRKVYHELYNIEDDFTALEELREELRLNVSTEKSNEEINKVTTKVVKEASKRLKTGKGDVSGSYNSDVLKNCPDSFYEMIAGVFRSWLTHGSVTKSFLACAFLPLVKGLKDPSLTASYRAVAGSSLVLKLLDYVILNIWGEQLASDSLQFWYKKGTSTTDCSWLVTSVADHFLRHGSPIMIATLDAKQGFDRCSWIKIFESLCDRLPAVITRILMFVYTQQSAYARWGSAISAPFTLSNSTRQGSVISPAIWCVYMEDLIARLRRLGLGCTVHGVYMGVTVYADDVVLLAPTRNALSEMLKVTEVLPRSTKLYFQQTRTQPNPSPSAYI